MPNNYGLRSREMAKAASFALKAAAIRKELSFSTAATLGERFSQFAKFAKEKGIKWLEHVDRSLVQTYGRELAERVASVVELCRELGLRSKEASLINARVALQEAQERGFVTILRGTKGGRERSAQIASERQLEALQRAAEAQGTDRALIPANQNWKGWREGPLRAARELVQEHTGGGLHDLRAAYACERYAQLTGHAAPVVGGRIEDRRADREAREIIAKEIGYDMRKLGLITKFVITDNNKE